MARNKFKRLSNLSSSENSECDAENIVVELKEKMSRLKFRLLDCQNQNQMLRKELLLAKKVVNAEVLPAFNESFDDVLHQATSTDYRGRREKILLLKDKLSALQNRIKDIEEGNIDKLPEDAAKTPKIERFTDQKTFQNKQMMDKELQYLLENSCQMKRKLEVWKKRNEELSKEAGVLRLELNSLLQKSKEDRNVHDSYHVVEKELRARQTEKLDMRNKLDAEKIRNEQLVEELATLKEDLSMILSKINDDKVLIDALNNQQGYMHDLLERQKMISESENSRFRDDLGEIQSRYTTSCELMNYMKSVVNENRLVCQQLQATMKQQALIDEVENTDARQTSTATITAESEQSQQDEPKHQSVSKEDPPPESNEELSEAENEAIKLTEELDQYVNVFRSTYEEVEQLRSILSANDDRLNEWMSQLFQSRSLLAKKNAEIRDLQETAKRLQRPLSSTKKLCAFPQHGSSFADEIKKMSDVLNEEYEFLLSFWELLTTKKENSLFVFTMSADTTTKLFAEMINDLILLEDKSELDEEGQEQRVVNEESAKDEANPTK